MSLFVHGPHPQVADGNRSLPAGAERRMARIMRMTYADVLRVLDAAHVRTVDGIYFGTGLGCLDDTERFLTEMATITSGPLSPTAFMRSTHNTVAGQLALLLGADGPNITFSQELFSFQLALLHALLHLSNDPDHTVLVGAVDERTDLADRLVHANTHVPLGEGTASFLVSGGAGANDAAVVEEIWIGAAADAATWEQRLANCGIPSAAIRTVVMGRDPFTGNAPWSPEGAAVVDIRERTGHHGSASAQLFAEAVERVRQGQDPVLQIERCLDQEAAILLRAC